MHATTRKQLVPTMARAAWPDRPVLRALLITLLTASSFLTQSVAADPATVPPLPRVTFIGDSIATGILYNPDAKRVLERGVDVDYQLAVCRRLVGDSCPYDGVKPLTLVELLPTIKLAPTVVVAVGYNDYQETFAESVDSSLEALRKAGAEHVLWLTLRAERQSYVQMNDVIRAAAERHRELTVVDWNLNSRSHPDWFQNDGLHLGHDGAVAMATLVHGALEDAGAVQAPPAASLSISTRTLPAGHVNKPYRTRLRASGGTRPITWRRQAGALPPGMLLRSDGRLAGTPRAAGRFTLTLRARDAEGQSSSRQFGMVVKAG